MTYTLHNELTDGTFEAAFQTLPTKAAALRVAKLLSKKPSFMVAKIVVVNAKTDLAVASFECPQDEAA